jgi:uncharacterized coiled-coil DUF342 family protein
MATWGDFLAEFKVVNLKSSGMFVKVDDVLSIWEERNRLRTELNEAKEALLVERAGCAQEIEEFADACAAEVEAPEELITVLRAAARLVRERGEVEEETEESPQTEDAGGA